MNAFDLSQSLPRIQRSFSQNESELEKRLQTDRTTADWSYETFIEADPSDNKKYLDWIIKSYILGGIKLYEDLSSRVKPALEDYMYLLQSGQLDTGKADKPWTNERVIENYCGLAGCTKKKRVLIGLDGLLDKYQSILSSKREKLEESEQIHQDTEVVYKNSQVTIYHPKTKDASCYYGQGTKWCTAATRGENMFKEYNKFGPLYIIVAKDGDKYQLHAESASLMDSKDEEVDYKMLITKYPSLDNFEPMKKYIKIKNFLKSVDQEDLQGIKEALDNGVNINEANNYAIRTASSKPNLDVLNVLYENGADLTANDNTPLKIACYKGNLVGVKFLYDHGIDLTVDDNEALIMASKTGQLDVIKFLVEHGVDPSSPTNGAIAWASGEGHIDVVRYLLSLPSSFGIDVANNNEAITVAFLKKHQDIFNLLEQHGAVLPEY